MEEQRKDHKATQSEYIKELKSTLNLSWALILTQACEVLFLPIAVMFGGHLGKIELDAVGLSIMLINVFGSAVVTGMVSCCETVFSQSYGYGDYKMIGVYLQRALVIHFLGLLPCYAIHINIEAILVSMAQDPQVSRLTGQYLLSFTPGLFCMFVTAVLRRYTQCQGSTAPHVVIMLVGHVIHATCQYLLLYQVQLGVLGSALSLDITYAFMCVATLIYTLFSKGHRQAWGGWDRRALHEWGPLARLAIFGVLMTCFEWWAFEMTVIIAGLIGVTEQAAQSVSINLDYLIYGVSYGISVATCIRVGQYLGAGEPRGAQRATRVGTMLAGASGLILGIIYALARFELPTLFTNDSDVINLIASILPIMAFYLFFAALNITGRGICRGIGWQSHGAFLSFISFYILALPIGIPLTFYTSLGVLGLWYGVSIGIAVLGVIYTVLFNFKINWEKLSKEAISCAADDQALAKRHERQSDKVEAEEKTPLLTGTYSLSHSLNVSVAMSLKPGVPEPQPKHLEEVTATLIIKRLLTVLLFLCILAAGVVARVVTEVNKDLTDIPYNNSTSLTALPLPATVESY